ncbi:MAG: hypothetical protein WAJ93_08565 [Candidatus Nitrosopolaris sp.]
MYNENHVDRSSKLKRRSTRHVSEITAIASEFGSSFVVGKEGHSIPSFRIYLKTSWGAKESR